MPNPAYHEAVAQEERNRLLAYLHRAPDLVLPLRSRRSMPFPVVTICNRHILALLRTGNAFLTGLAPRIGDFIEILWLLHPYYRTAHGSFPNLEPGTKPPLRLYVWLTQCLIRITCRQLMWAPAEFVIRQRIRDAFQDRETPARSGSDSVSALAPSLTHLDDIARHFTSWTATQILDESVARCLQVLRAQGIREGRADDFVPPSAALIKLPTPETTPPPGNLVQFES